MMNFVKKNKYVIVFCALLAAGAYGGYQYYVSTTQTTSTVKLAQVTRGNLTKTVSATGSLSAIDNVDISSKITGRIVEVRVKENQFVKAGDILVKLDDTSLKATMQEMKAKLDNATANYHRYAALVEQGAISEYDYDSKYTDYLVAKNNYEAAVSNLEDTIIKTPIDGYIIGEPTPEGQTISSGISEPQVIMSVATLDNMQIETKVDESDIGQIVLGQKVRFTVDAYPNETFTGVVRLISRDADTENNVVYYPVYVSVDDAKGKLLPTMTARADFLVDSAQDVLIAPLNCIYNEGKRRYVKIYNAKSKESEDVDVTVGLSSDDEVAITAGEVKEGDTLLVKKAVATQTNNRMGPPM